MKWYLCVTFLFNSALLVSSWMTPSKPRQTHFSTSLFVSSTTPNHSSPAADEVDTNAVLQSLKDLLEHLDGPDGGKKLYQTSSPSWRHAICQAVGAPDTADDDLVADALQQAMARPHNQFAILMGTAKEAFTAVFPTDPVVNDDHAIWVECQLREKESDKLLVDLGVNLRKDDADGRWKIDDLQ